MTNTKKTKTLLLAKYLLAAPIAALLVLGNVAQASSGSIGKTTNVVPVLQETQINDNDKPFVTVDQMPSFPGGEAEMYKFLRDNLQYPVEAQKAGIQGRVTVRFVVDKDGSLINKEVIRGAFPKLDQEALRIIDTMPKWVPGKHEGKEVPVYYTLPIVFRITGAESNASPAKSKPLFKAERMPSFPGGVPVMREFIRRKLQYPVGAEKAGIQGRVTVGFVVEEDGKLNEIKILRGVSPELDMEALHVVRSMPDWIPGIENGKNVRVHFSLPITFNLGKENF